MNMPLNDMVILGLIVSSEAKGGWVVLTAIYLEEQEGMETGTVPTWLKLRMLSYPISFFILQTPISNTPTLLMRDFKEL